MLVGALSHHCLSNRSPLLRRIALLLPSFILACGCATMAMAQKRDKTLPPTTQPTTTAPGPKRDKTVPQPTTGNEPAQPTIEKVFVKPNEGYLALYTTPSAFVSLTQIGSKRRLTTTGAAAADGLFKIPRLKPSNYRLEIKLTDHESIS